ncbi:MAG: histidine phosphatase family protein [bacterium]|nr:histidine phosphatase family protein [bacterium]
MPGGSSSTAPEVAAAEVPPGASGRGPETYLVLLRHGRTDLNRQGLLQGASDLPLDDLGRRQAVEAGEYVRRHWQIDKVVCSPRRRARETLVHAGFDEDVITDDRLAEMDYGALEGTPVPLASGELIDAWTADPGYAPSGGESLASLYDRSVRACEHLLATSANQTVLVCSHANPIKAIVSWALGGEASGILRMYLRQASVSVVASIPPAVVLLGFNERTEPS